MKSTAKTVEQPLLRCGHCGQKQDTADPAEAPHGSIHTPEITYAYGSQSTTFTDVFFCGRCVRTWAMHDLFDDLAVTRFGKPFDEFKLKNEIRK